ncbi:hypothetical protein [Streptomyces sp. NPDC055036]
MSLSLIKTRPGAEFHMGALLRGALAFQGISVRVDRPWRSIPSEYLVAEREGHTRVWMHAVSWNGGFAHYDIPRGELMGVAAVITDDVSTRFVYDGFSADATRPVAQAEEMAAAVARHFGMPVREVPDPFANEDAATQSELTNCACRGCTDTAITSDSKPALCLLCKGAECEISYGAFMGGTGEHSTECQREDAYER